MQVAFKSSSTVQRSGARSSTRRSVLRVVAQAGPVSRRDLLSVGELRLSTVDGIMCLDLDLG